MKKLYIDIDGVLLTKKNTKPSNGAEEFINHITEKYDCYWLTTHCRNGNTDSLLNMMSQYFSPEIVKKLKNIKPTAWDTLKTEAIDFTSEFYWLDDFVFEAEKNVLKRHNSLDRLILVDLINGPNLFDVLNFL